MKHIPVVVKTLGIPRISGRRLKRCLTSAFQAQGITANIALYMPKPKGESKSILIVTQADLNKEDLQNAIRKRFQDAIVSIVDRETE
jgi:hypothetical protein